MKLKNWTFSKIANYKREKKLLKLAEDMDVYGYMIFAHSIEEGQTKINYFT